MIGRLTGNLVDKHPPQLVLDVNGVGYELEAPMSTFYNLPAAGEKVTLLTHLVVREDAQVLYGFLTASERVAFRTLIRIGGVGPKLALAVLSGLSVDDLGEAVAMQETGRITRIPGIGRKTAERLLLELKDKLPRIGGVASTASGQAVQSSNDVLNALLALGYNEREVVQVVKELPSDLSVEEGIRAALKRLSKF
jgi:holliday junction DNA helicase RuvA